MWGKERQDCVPCSKALLQPGNILGRISGCSCVVFPHPEGTLLCRRACPETFPRVPTAGPPCTSSGRRRGPSTPTPVSTRSEAQRPWAQVVGEFSTVNPLCILCGGTGRRPECASSVGFPPALPGPSCGVAGRWLVRGGRRQVESGERGRPIRPLGRQGCRHRRPGRAAPAGGPGRRRPSARRVDPARSASVPGCPRWDR